MLESVVLEVSVVNPEHCRDAVNVVPGIEVVLVQDTLRDDPAKTLLFTDGLEIVIE